jgi:uncharacterized protein (DUF3084 family)
MGYYQVSDENVAKVEAYFVRRAKETGSNRIEATVIEIAEGSEVALATAHKAIKELVKEKAITVIKPKSRRFPITYVYNKDIDDFEAQKSQEGQIEYLQAVVKQLKEQVENLSKEVNEINGQKRILENRLHAYENQNNQLHH